MCRSGRLPSAIAALVLALVPAPAYATDWTTFGFNAERTGFNPAERALGPITARALLHRWSYDLGGVINAQPLYSDGVVFAGSERGRFAALDAATGTPLWTRNLSTVDTICADVPDGIHGVSATPVLDPERGTIWVAGGDGRVWALDIATGRTRAGWPVQVGKKAEHIWGALGLASGRLYVPTASHCNNAYYRGGIVSLDPDTGRRRGKWRALGRRAYGGGIWGWGGAAIEGGDRDVFVATANAQGLRRGDTPYAEHVVRLSRGLEFEQANDPGPPRNDDNDFTGAPVLFDPPGCPPELAVIHKTAQLFLYDRRRIRRGPLQRIQVGSLKAFTALGTYAYWPQERMLFVANGSTGDYEQGLVALRVNSSCRLELAWQQPFGTDATWPTPPAVANGIVVFGDGSGKRLRVLDALDGTILWDSGAVTGDLYGGPIVADGRVFAPSWDERVHAWSP